jgi:PAS domain S-box-containing protein
MGRWRVAAGALVPLVPAAVFAVVQVGEASSVVLLLAAVAVASLLGGWVAGAASVILSTFLYDLVVLPPRGLVLDAQTAPHLGGYALTAVGTVAVVAGLRSSSRRAQRGQAAAEARARRLTERIELIGPVLDTAPVGFAVLDQDLRYRYVNGRLAEIDGIAAAEHVGRRPRELFAPELAEAVEAPARRVLVTGVVQPAETVAVPMAGVVRYFLSSRHPLRDGTGAVVGLVVTVLDTTEQVQAQRSMAAAAAERAQLAAEAERLRAIAELAFKLSEAQRLAGFGSWDYDLTTGAVSWSPQMLEIIGVDDPNPELADVGRYVHPDDKPRAAEARRALLDEHRPFSIEVRLIRPDGRHIEVVSTGEAIRDEQGRAVRFWGTIQDVTEHRAAERAAREAIRRAEQTRSQSEAEHQALQMFQRAMLPAELPSVPGVEVAAVYQPVVERIDIGGDWYDAFVLPDGRLALAVGDVTGHDLRAATVMGQVRNAVRAYACEDPSPGEVLRRVNALLSRLPDLDLVTMLFGAYDPAAGELVWSNAGHPPPLLRRDGTVTPLTDEGGLLLGVLPDQDTYPQHRLTLAPGDAVLWYTDGLVDQRDVDPAAASRRLADLFAGDGDGDDREDAGGLLASVSRGMLDGGELEDDVCLLAVRRVGPTPDAARAAPARRGGKATRGSKTQHPTDPQRVDA